jgi:hypothetical protein
VVWPAGIVPPVVLGVHRLGHTCGIDLDTVVGVSADDVAKDRNPLCVDHVAVDVDPSVPAVRDLVAPDGHILAFHVDAMAY